MKYFHWFAQDNEEKFSKSYINFINNNFNESNHYFLIDRNRQESNSNYSFGRLKHRSEVIKLIYSSEKVFLHGLSRPMIFFFIFQPWLLKKTNWCIWGGDLYYHTKRKTNAITMGYDFFRKFVIQNISGIITQLKGDYELAQKWYGAKGNYYYAFMYPSNLYKEYDLKKVEKDTCKTYVQVGNSACETNEHIEVFEKLSKYKNENIEIICPLSYSGKEEYIKQIIEIGYNIFGKEKFTPITDFMPFDKYLELLAKVDIAIFNHKRQRGLGNITTLLGLGKKVYIREEITTWQFCIEHNLKVCSANGNYDALFEEMDEDIKQKNIENMSTKFSEEKLVEDLKKIFDEEVD